MSTFSDSEFNYGNLECKFHTVSSEVSFFVGNPAFLFSIWFKQKSDPLVEKGQLISYFEVIHNLLEYSWRLPLTEVENGKFAKL